MPHSQRRPRQERCYIRRCRLAKQEPRQKYLAGCSAAHNELRDLKSIYKTISVPTPNVFSVEEGTALTSEIVGFEYGVLVRSTALTVMNALHILRICLRL
jgi:hypothetical protein